MPKHQLPEIWIHRTPERSFFGPLGTGLPGGPKAQNDGLRAMLRAALHGGESGGGAGWLHVLLVLVRTDFRARYRGQALGMVWSVLYPLVMMGIMSVIFSRVFRSHIQNFPIFLLIGLILWQWVTSSISSATQVFVSHSDVVKRTVFPRQLLPMAMVLSHGINCAIEASTLLLFIPIYPEAFVLSPAVLLLPVYVLILGILLTGVALGVSVLNVIYRDVAYIVNTGLLLLYWLTPIIYPASAIPYPYMIVIQGNPLAGIVYSMRLAIMEGKVPSALGWAGMLLPTALIFLVGYGLFRHYEKMVLDYV